MTTISDLLEMVEWMDRDLDGNVAEPYKREPLAQDWARVTKAGEEVGEAIDALIGLTGQNPRKGQYGSLEELLDELADVALTGLYAIQHFTKDRGQTLNVFLNRAAHHKARRLEGRALCPTCGGSGSYVAYVTSPMPLGRADTYLKNCDTCHGTGRVDA